ncbi:MAG TPA: hydrogenase expression/formation protein HypE, partial [Gemmatimonadaceae bacterium]
LMRQLIAEVFTAAFDPDNRGDRHDGAVLPVPAGARLALTTDSYVVYPHFFPDGDIGALAVNGTVNDLAMCGARPAWLTAGFILEEGLPFDVLRRVAISMRDAAAAAGVRIVTGDTKVVERGKADGLFINTTGVGWVRDGVDVRPARLTPGDAIIVSGDIARHGIAILAAREGVAFGGPLVSDCAALAAPVAALLDAGIDVHVLRDCTRGGLAASLIELAEDGGADFDVESAAIPVSEPVRGACEALGLDPLNVACEGRFVAFVPDADAVRALALLRHCPVSADAAAIGRVTARAPGQVRLRSPYGPTRRLLLPAGEPLPRIC